MVQSGDGVVIQFCSEKPYRVARRSYQGLKKCDAEPRGRDGVARAACLAVGGAKGSGDMRVRRCGFGTCSECEWRLER